MDTFATRTSTFLETASSIVKASPKNRTSIAEGNLNRFIRMFNKADLNLVSPHFEKIFLEVYLEHKTEILNNSSDWLKNGSINIVMGDKNSTDNGYIIHASIIYRLALELSARKSRDFYIDLLRVFEKTLPEEDPKLEDTIEYWEDYGKKKKEVVKRAPPGDPFEGIDISKIMSMTMGMVSNLTNNTEGVTPEMQDSMTSIMKNLFESNEVRGIISSLSSADNDQDPMQMVSSVLGKIQNSNIKELVNQGPSVRQQEASEAAASNVKIDDDEGPPEFD